MPETPDTHLPAADESAAESAAETEAIRLDASVDPHDAAEISGSDDSADVVVETAPPVADEALLASVDLARRALLEATAPETVGSVIGHIVEGEHVLSLLFASDLAGYPGWRWSVTIARVDDAEPTVLETELMPGEQALLAPEWVPWSERLAEYRAAQQAAAELAAAAGDDEADEFEEEPDEDDDLDGEADEDSDEDDDAEDDADEDDDSDDDGLSHDDDAFDGIDIDALDVDDDDDVDDADHDDDDVDDADHLEDEDDDDDADHLEDEATPTA
ncbi:DUF3027 domain-containing protein [Agromyces sp. NPDC058126]|uniref:DUF3027 domain-containing protein n=1 Tax=Agromyces sp. NPDC058126 TaxID=3346350 RepID=UPI0036D9A217